RAIRKMPTMASLREALPRTVSAIDAGMVSGQHIGAQGFVSVAAQTIADFALGESRPGVAMTSDSLMFWLSATKPVVAVCIAQLWERDRLQLDDRVAEHIP